MLKDLREAVDELKRAPDRRVLAQVEGMVIEISVQRRLSADDVFKEVGAWEGESAEELQQLVSQARKDGGSKPPPKL